MFNMNKIVRIGILKETKSPPDRRVPFTPAQIKVLKERFPWTDFYLQPSEIRCFADNEYAGSGIELKNDLSHCDILFGIKEVGTDTLINGKTYLFFSHTGKMQSHNRKLLQEMALRKITIIDYEYLTDQNNNRLVAFGRWAGIVGAYNGLRAWGEKYGLYRLKPAYQCFDLEELKTEMLKVSLTGVRILITGGGRVAGGAMEILSALNIRTVNPEEFLNGDFTESILCRLDPWHYTRKKDGTEFSMDHFVAHPDQYESIFKPYTKAADLFIACHYWDPASPVLIQQADMQESDFSIKVIADVSCDINGSIKSTIRASSIDNPFYGYNPYTGTEFPSFAPGSITIMAVDNLPGELPRNSSEDFGRMLMDRIIPALLEGDSRGIISRATILKDGKLTPQYSYLRNYLKSP
jgi:saccharopine dehydrogenase (NAD+, L-lysine-forming)